MTRCVLLVPVKAWPRAKSRLRVPEVGAPALAAAFAADALDAASRAPAVAEVVVVTDAENFTWPGVTVLADRGRGDLNAALRAAAEDLGERGGGLAMAAMCADLPCLCTADLQAALEAAAGHRAFVADAAGTGTTLLVAAPDTPLDPHFGVGSARAHGESGAVPVDLAVATLRRDVDTDADLADAVALGVGRRTRAVLDGVGQHWGGTPAGMPPQ